MTSTGDRSFNNICTKGCRNLKLRPFKTVVVHVLKEHDLVARICFCSWILRSVHDGEVDPQLMFFFLMTPGFPCVEQLVLEYRKSRTYS